jgi:hypothetical protein
MEQDYSGFSEQYLAKLKWLKEVHDDPLMDDAPVISGPKPTTPEEEMSNDEKSGHDQVPLE